MSLGILRVSYGAAPGECWSPLRNAGQLSSGSVLVSLARWLHGIGAAAAFFSGLLGENEVPMPQASGSVSQGHMEVSGDIVTFLLSQLGRSGCCWCLVG